MNYPYNSLMDVKTGKRSENNIIQSEILFLESNQTISVLHEIQ